MHTNKEQPKPFTDVIAWIKFEDIGPVAQIGYCANHEKHGFIFLPKLWHNAAAWEQIIKWDYMADVLPEYTYFPKEKKK